MRTIFLLFAGSICTLITFTSCFTNSTAMLGTANTATKAIIDSPNQETPLTETEIDTLTHRIYAIDYDELYHRILYKLQSNGCYISGSDKAAGVITARLIKREKKMNDNCQHLSFLITPFNDNQTEVRLTIYADILSVGSSTSIKVPSVYNVEQKGIVRDKAVYDAWFNELLSEYPTR